MPRKAPLVLTATDGASLTELSDFEWQPALSGDKDGAQPVVPFSVAGVRQLHAAGHDLLVTGKVLAALADLCDEAVGRPWRRVNGGLSAASRRSF